MPIERPFLKSIPVISSSNTNMINVVVYINNSLVKLNEPVVAEISKYVPPNVATIIYVSRRRC